MSKAESLLAPYWFCVVIADRGYDSDPIRERLSSKRIEVVITSRSYLQNARLSGRLRSQERNVIERFIKKASVAYAFPSQQNLVGRSMAFPYLATTLKWCDWSVNSPNSLKGTNEC